MIYIIYVVLLCIINLLWLMTVPFALPGNWLMIIGTAMFAWWQRDNNVFSPYTILAIVILAILGEIIEFLSGFGGAKRAGASWKGSMGALVGAVIGAVAGSVFLPVPLLGTLIGACCGAGAGALAVESLGGKELRESMRYGFAASLGQFVGIASKFAIGCAIWLIIAVAGFLP